MSEQTRRMSVINRVAAAVVLFGVAASPVQAQTTRDPWLWPFASNSIWNTPIGSNANYQNANLQDENGAGLDAEHFVKTTTSDPYRTVYNPGPWDNRTNNTVNWLGSMRLPDSFVVANSYPGHTPNNCATFLQPDGRTMIQMAPTTRPNAGGAIWGWPQVGDNAGGSLLRDGTYGTHYGSGLSAIGGSIRKGEMNSASSMRHALKLQLWCAKYLYYSASDATPGYRWPAKNADNYAGNASGGYKSTNPKLEQGALLAIPPTTTESSLGLGSAQAKKLFWTLQNFGAYIVEDTYGSFYQFGAEDGVQSEWNVSNADVMKLMKALKIVDNNAPSSVGGGGSPRTDNAPPLSTLVGNPGFDSENYDTQTPSGWSEWSNIGGVGAGYTEAGGGSRNGARHGAHYSSGAYNMYTFQSKSGLANGLYTLRCWARSGGGQLSCYLEAKDFGGAARTSTLPVSSSYQLVEIKDINVTNGQCTIGVYTNSNGNQWCNFDDFEFFQQ